MHHRKLATSWLAPTKREHMSTHAEWQPNGVGGHGGHGWGRRRAQFATTAEMQAQLHGKGSYPLFETRVFNDYCEHGLLPNGEGQFELACPPAIEASVYMAARTNIGVFDSVRAL